MHVHNRVIKLLISESKTYAFTTSEDWVGLGKLLKPMLVVFVNFL